MKVGVRGEVEPCILTDVMVVLKGCPALVRCAGFSKYGLDARVGERVSIWEDLFPSEIFKFPLLGREGDVLSGFVCPPLCILDSLSALDACFASLDLASGLLGLWGTFDIG